MVLTNNNGCAVVRSEKAKALGTKMGASAFQLRDFIARHRIRVFIATRPCTGAPIRPSCLPCPGGGQPSRRGRVGRAISGGSCQAKIASTSA